MLQQWTSLCNCSWFLFNVEIGNQLKMFFVLFFRFVNFTCSLFFLLWCGMNIITILPFMSVITSINTGASSYWVITDLYDITYRLYIFLCKQTVPYLMHYLIQSYCLTWIPCKMLSLSSSRLIESSKSFMTWQYRWQRK